jgi:hypothetical protein
LQGVQPLCFSPAYIQSSYTLVESIKKAARRLPFFDWLRPGDAYHHMP